VGEETIRGWLPPQAPDSEPPGRWDSELPPAAPPLPLGTDAGDDEKPPGPGSGPGGGARRGSGIPTGFRREPGR
jgi:hypothetical protein